MTVHEISASDGRVRPNGSSNINASATFVISIADSDGPILGSMVGCNDGIVVVELLDVMLS